eukprot:24925_1
MVFVWSSCGISLFDFTYAVLTVLYTYSDRVFMRSFSGSGTFFLRSFFLCFGSCFSPVIPTSLFTNQAIACNTRPIICIDITGLPFPMYTINSNRYNLPHAFLVNLYYLDLKTAYIIDVTHLNGSRLYCIRRNIN